MGSIAIDDPDRRQNGTLKPGHRWKMPAWRPGKSGHTARYTPNRLVTVCAAYIDECEANTKPLTWAGLAVFLGLSRKGLDMYANGEIGTDRPGIVSVLDYMKATIEAEREAMLSDKAYATQGVIFALKNQAGWRDEKHINLESVEKQQLIVQVDPELKAMLEQQRGEVFDAEYTRVEGDQSTT